ncbi:MAG: hypothetical protein V4590_07980 [Bacteroidota bacterium]
MNKQTVDQIIEGILKAFDTKTGYSPTWNELWEIWIDTPELTDAVNKMQSLGILKLNDGKYYALDKFGHEVNEMGGWKGYKTLERYRRKSILLFWLGPFIASCALLYTVYFNEQKNRTITELETKVSKVELKLQRLQESHPYLLQIPQPSATIIEKN